MLKFDDLCGAAESTVGCGAIADFRQPLSDTGRIAR